MVINDSGSSADTSLATLLSNLSLTQSPPSCDADAYLTEPEILRAYQGSFPSTLFLFPDLLTRSLGLVVDLESFVHMASAAPDLAHRLLAVTFEHAFSAVCCASVCSGICY